MDEISLHCFFSPTLSESSLSLLLFKLVDFPSPRVVFADFCYSFLKVSGLLLLLLLSY